MSRYSPAPWYIAGKPWEDDSHAFGVYSGAANVDGLTGKTYYPNCQQVLPFYDCDLKFGINGGRHLADAHMISASPEMYEALEQFIAEFERGPEHVSMDTLDRAVRATRKARGESE